MSALTPDEVILGLLAAQTRHGYELLDCFRDSAQLGRVWKLSTSQLYNVLKRLERQGWVQGEAVTPENAPTRVEYTLTAAGKAQLQAWLEVEEPAASIQRVRVEFLSRLYIARLLNLPTIEIVLRQKAVCQREYERLLDQRGQANPGIEYLTLDFVIGQLEAVLLWIDRCELVPTLKEDDIDDL